MVKHGRIAWGSAMRCYKDPVLKDQQWSAYIDRSPGAVSYSEECFHACVAGCGYKYFSDGRIGMLVDPVATSDIKKICVCFREHRVLICVALSGIPTQLHGAFALHKKLSGVPIGAHGSCYLYGFPSALVPDTIIFSIMCKET